MASMRCATKPTRGALIGLVAACLLAALAVPASAQRFWDRSEAQPPATRPAATQPAATQPAKPSKAVTTPQNVEENIDRVGEEIAAGDVWGAVQAVGGVAVAIWRMELFKAGDEPITISQLVVALLVLVLGVWLAKRVTKLMQRRLLRHRRVDVNAAALIQKLVFYLMIMVIGLIALGIAGIPITIFTVLGGAVAIGIGFGAQALFGNLISGLILMVEKPIRLGDIVEVSGMQGRVEEIANRCTRVRRFDGIDVLVPNRTLLDEPVINWTLYDSDVRGSVTVGVAYGSRTDMVERLIMKVVSGHEKVHEKPPPEVLFQEFGDNSLNFEVFFWTGVTRPMDLRRVESDIRYRIDAVFREAEIEIAFPQRDVHFKPGEPLTVRLKQITEDEVRREAEEEAEHERDEKRSIARAKRKSTQIEEEPVPLSRDEEERLNEERARKLESGEITEEQLVEQGDAEAAGASTPRAQDPSREPDAEQDPAPRETKDDT